MSVGRDNGTAMAVMCDEVKRRWEEGDEKVSPIAIARWYEEDESLTVEELREEGMIANAKDSIEMARNDLDEDGENE